MEQLGSAAVADHYRSVAPVLLRHLAGRHVRVDGWSGGWSGPVATEAALSEAVGSGGRWLAVPAASFAPRSVVRLATGQGTDISTAAMVALNLLGAEGAGQPLIMTDGDNGLLLLAEVSRERAEQLIQELAARAPELATVDPAEDDGRVLLTIPAGDDLVPVPYSLLDGTDGTGVVLPVLADEIAAAAAGMPLEPDPARTAGRLLTHGDLAAAVADPPGPPA